MNISVFEGKTIKSIKYDYSVEIEFTDGTTLDISSRYEGGIEIYTEMEQTFTEKRKTLVELDRTK